MADETAEEGLEGGHRPLPSVDMPLLRNQRRAVRARQVAGLSAAAALVVGGIVGVIWLSTRGGDGAPNDAADGSGAAANDENLPYTPLPPGERPPVEPAPGEAAAAEATGIAPPTAPLTEGTPSTVGAVTRETREFGQSRGFRDALARAGSSPEERTEIEQAMTDVLDFRRCRPQDRMIFERDTGGALVLFQYRGGSATEYYQAARSTRGELVGEKVQIPIERTRVARGGVLQSSLGAALEQVGFGRALVGVFVEVFDGRVNFSTQARTGDTFRVIVDEEKINGRFLRWGTVHAVEYVGQRAGTMRAFHFEPREGEGDYYDESGRAVHGGWLRTPLRFDRISSRYDPRRMHPILRRVVPHNGVDYAAGTGTPVWAAARGTISFAGVRGANGNLVSIRHEGGYESFYAHLHRIERGIRNGVAVRQRQVIGYVGSTGRSTGPHLHFGLKRRGGFLDPLAEINGPGRMMPAAALGRYRGQVRRLGRELDRIALSAQPPAQAAPAPEPEPEQVSGELPMD